MRVVQRDADLLAAVLEAEHLLDAGLRRQLRGPVRPGLDDGARPVGREVANDASWSLEKQITSHRPAAGPTGHSGCPSTSPEVASGEAENDGNRFSNTTTS